MTTSATSSQATTTSAPGVLSGDSDIRARPQEEAGDFSLEPVPEPDAEELSLQEIYAKCYPSVVGITAMVSDTSYLWGTGIVILEDGYIATNAHIMRIVVLRNGDAV